MIGRVLLAALLSGIAAGLVMACVQYTRLTPIILESEKYEVADMSHHHGAEVDAPAPQADTPAPQAEATANAMPAGHDHSNMASSGSADAAEASWKPDDGWQRTLYTTLASIVTAAGFAALLAGVSLVTGMAITPANGLLWGICGFLAINLATSAGLPPALPGMPEAELVPRQVWWVATAAATGAALYVLFTRREVWAWVAAAVLVLAPHIIGAPQPGTAETEVPAMLANSFVASSLAANAIMWCVIGLLLGRFLPPVQEVQES